MKLLLKSLLIFIGVFFLPKHLFWTCGQLDQLSSLSYKLPNEKLWVQNKKSLIDGTAYYQLQNDESIRLKSMILSSNLYPASRSQTEKEIVDKIFNAKKSLFRVLGASDYKINSYKMVNRGKGKELELSFQFFLKNKMSYSHEKYFIHPDQTLMVDLSWSSNSQARQIQFARNEFANIRAVLNRN